MPRTFQHSGIQLVDELATQLGGPPRTPPRGWIFHARNGRKLSNADFARRMGVAPSSAHELEQREQTGHITLRKLHQAADVLGLDLVYGFVPRLKPYFDHPDREPQTLEELYYASLDRPAYRELFMQRVLALNAEEEALVGTDVEHASVGEGQVLAPLAGEDALEHLPGLA